MVERFGRGHAGQALTQLPSRPYSYLVDMVMDNYAYTYAMSNRLLGYMQIKGVTSLRPTGPPILCPMKCKNADLRGGLHAVTCKKLGQHTRTHSALESLILEMARDALAIPLSQQRAAVTLCDEKRREEPSNLFATIPVVPPSGNYRAYGDLLIVRNTFLPPHQFPQIGDGPRTNAYNARYAASRPPTGITAALDFLRWMAAKGAAYFFIDVHFSGLSSRDLCSAAKQKKAEYLAAWNNFRSNVVTRAQKELWELYQQVNHTQNGRPTVCTFGINYDGFIDPSGCNLMMYFAELKYPEDPNNRSYQVSRQRWISHYVRRIQQVLNNVVKKEY